MNLMILLSIIYPLIKNLRIIVVAKSKNLKIF